MKLRINNNNEKKVLAKRKTAFSNEIINENNKSTKNDIDDFQSHVSNNENNKNEVTLCIDKSPLENDIKSSAKIKSSLNNDLDKFIKSKTESLKIDNKKEDVFNDNKTPTLKKENIHKDHRKRLKQQFLDNGLKSLTDIQKLELLLFFSIPQKDTNPLAHNLLNKFKTLKNIFSAEPSKLMEVSGIKDNTAILIKLVNSLFSYISMPSSQNSISSVSESKDFCSKLYVGSDIEQFYVICLTKSNQIKDVKLIQSGSADEVTVQIRNITEFALETKCNRIIISHNHPNGSALMSDEDCAFTYSLICSCLLNSIEIIDHIIVGTDKAISLASQNILQKLKEKAVTTINLSRQKFSFLSSLSNDYLINE